MPEIAARAHLAHLPGLVRGVMAGRASASASSARVAATSGPGLIGGLIVGASFGKGIAIAHGLPFVAVNHLEAHALTAAAARRWCRAARRFPICCCCCPAGIANAWRWRGVGRIAAWAARWTTRWARRSTSPPSCWAWAGRAGRRWSGWRRPGMPSALRPAPAAAGAGRAAISRFSGLKTAVAQLIAAYPPGALPDQDRADLAAGFQAAVAEVLADRAQQRHGAGRDGPGTSLLVVAGGVAANAAVRAALAQVAARQGFRWSRRRSGCAPTMR